MATTIVMVVVDHERAADDIGVFIFSSLTLISMLFEPRAHGLRRDHKPTSRMLGARTKCTHGMPSSEKTKGLEKSVLGSVRRDQRGGAFTTSAKISRLLFGRAAVQ